MRSRERRNSLGFNNAHAYIWRCYCSHLRNIHNTTIRESIRILSTLAAEIAGFSKNTGQIYNATDAVYKWFIQFITWCWDHRQFVVPVRGQGRIGKNFNSNNWIVGFIWFHFFFISSSLIQNRLCICETVPCTHVFFWKCNSVGLLC
jgi:hypothetical protein